MEICKERFNTNDGCFCLTVPQTHTEKDTDQTDREAKKWEKCKWKSRKARGSREKKETRSVHEQVEQHLQERRNLSLSQNQKPPNPKQKKKKNPQEDKEKRDSLWLSLTQKKNLWQ